MTESNKLNPDSKMYKPKEFAERIGICVRTLQRWDNAGILYAYKTPTGRRFYTEEQLMKAFEYIEYTMKEKENKAPSVMSEKLKAMKENNE